MGAHNLNQKIKIANTLPWPDNYPDRQMCIEHFRAHIRWKERSISLSSMYLMLGYGQLSPTQMFVVYVRVHELPTYGKDENVYHFPKPHFFVCNEARDPCKHTRGQPHGFA